MLVKTTGISWDFGEPVVQQVKLARAGTLTGTDRERLFKRASASVRSLLTKYSSDAKPDETLVHMLAIGATEDYGPNRNGDGFSREACQKYHPTFQKFARFYRDHKNTDPSKSYGRIVTSAWNDDLRVVELLVALNATKSAAARNGGLVADQELQMLEEDKDIPVSMACKIAYDVCSACGNKAPTLDDYCRDISKGGRCKAGGLHEHIGELRELDGMAHHLHAINEHPYFFDISKVYRPADRIAYVTSHIKSANDRRQSLSSALEARTRGITIPLSVLSGDPECQAVAALAKLAYAMSAAERAMPKDELHRYYDADDMESMSIPPEFQTKTAEALRALADHTVCLSPARFIELMTGCGIKQAKAYAAQVTPYLHTVFQDLVSSPDLIEQLENVNYIPAFATTPSLHKWAVALTPELSLQPRNVQRRTMHQVVKDSCGSRRTKTSSVQTVDDPNARQLAREYGLYQLCFLDALPSSRTDLPLTQRLLLAQNLAS